MTHREMIIEAYVQKVIEKVVLRLERTLHAETGEQNLCLAGGVALNCVANGRLLREGPFENIWIQPAAGDAGGALGAAAIVWHDYLDAERKLNGAMDAMQGAFLGPGFSAEGIRADLDAQGAVYREHSDAELLPRLAELLEQENVIGWAQGRMEFGPRAPGGRAIIGDPRSAKMQAVINLKIEYRESFRPFGQSVQAGRVA